MQSVSPDCASCGVPLKISPTAQYVICGRCKTRLVVHRTGARVYTSLFGGAPSGNGALRSPAVEGQGEPPDPTGGQVPQAKRPAEEPQARPVTAAPGSPAPISGQAVPAPAPATSSAIAPRIEPAVALVPEEIQSFRLPMALLGGIAGIALAAAGEWLVESHDTSQVSLLLYLAGIAIFAMSAWLVRLRASDLPEGGLDAPASRPERLRAWALLGGGAALAFVLNIIAALLIRDQLDSAPGLYLWLASLVVIMVTGVVAGRALNWSPRWGRGVFPAGRNERLLLLAVVVVILVVASAARLIALDKIPFGINADEGDRASTSIQIVRGYNTSSIFDSGWYFISNLYFWLLAQLMSVIGVGFAQARVFGALASIISVAAVTWIGIRHFSLRVGLLAGALLSLLAISLQFARETSEAGPTATLWAVSFALMLEGARTGRSWAWIGSGLAGGFSLYFYPSARLWAVVAVPFCAYLLVNGLGNRRLGILRGAVLAGVAALLIASPFFVHTLPIFGNPGDVDIFTHRAQETSIFVNDNPSRLSYYNHNWNTVQLLAAQFDRSVGMFNQFHDDAGFWPTDRPVMWGLLTVLTLLGVGWASLRWRDPRYVLLALWFWVGLAGVIVTVETPNVQRFAAAVPVLALFPALLLDNMARRVEDLFARRKWLAMLRVSWLASGLAAAVVLFLAWSQYDFYFNVYGNTDRWPQPTIQGTSVRDQGADTLVVSVGREYHQVNSGWVRLMAPDTPRGGMRNPGLDMPLNRPADKNLSIMLYPVQTDYIPYISSIYPVGTTIPYTQTSEGLIVDMYRIPQEQWAATQGAMATVSGNSPAKVATLGEVPPGFSAFPAAVRWTAGLRVDRYWNYMFRVQSGPARLTIDGVQVLDAPANQAAQATVSLARGLHYVEYAATVSDAQHSPLVDWAFQPETKQDGTSDAAAWAPPGTEELYALLSEPRGLFGVLQPHDGDNKRPEQKRLDGTLAFCCPTDQIGSGGKPFTATWTGTLTAPATGVYSMTLLAQGAVDLKIDDKTIMHSDASSDAPMGGSADLTAGPHPVQVTMQVDGGPGGLEWVWTPPGGVRSIVPPSALSPPPHAGIAGEVPQKTLGHLTDQPPPGSALETVP